MPTRRTMTKALLIAPMLAVLPVSSLLAGWDPNKDGELEREARAAAQMMLEADPGLKRFFEEAYGYAIFPRVGKGAVGIGGARGKGVVYEQGSVIGKSQLTKISVGFALGGQTFSEIIFFRNQQALSDFTGGEFEFAAEASAVAIKEGASSTVDYSDDVAVFVMTRGGLMFEASIGGQSFEFRAK